MNMTKVLFSWSGGKDSAMALQEVLKGEQHQIAALLTTVTADYDRVSMHGVRRTLLEQQADSLGLEIEEVIIPKESTNEVYETRMAETLSRHKDLGVTSVVFGDIFLEDLRQYRERNLARLGMTGIFPLWKRDTHELMGSFIESGFRAVTVCVDGNALGREYVGREIDRGFVANLPEGVDVCGENGEYHSFAYDGPIFNKPIAHEIGDVVLRENRFYYCDLVPVC